jgi:hypothetical protein
LSKSLPSLPILPSNLRNKIVEIIKIFLKLDNISCYGSSSNLNIFNQYFLSYVFNKHKNSVGGLRKGAWKGNIRNSDMGMENGNMKNRNVGKQWENMSKGGEHEQGGRT